MIRSIYLFKMPDIYDKLCQIIHEAFIYSCLNICQVLDSQSVLPCRRASIVQPEKNQFDLLSGRCWLDREREPSTNHVWCSSEIFHPFRLSIHCWKSHSECKFLFYNLSEVVYWNDNRRWDLILFLITTHYRPEIFTGESSVDGAPTIGEVANTHNFAIFLLPAQLEVMFSHACVCSGGERYPISIP